MLCSDAKLDSHRFKDMLDGAIAAGEAFFHLLFMQAGLNIFCSTRTIELLHLVLTWLSILRRKAKNNEVNYGSSIMRPLSLIPFFSVFIMVLLSEFFFSFFEK